MELVKMQRYESYRDSGVDWIGGIPSDWDISRLGSCLIPVSVKNKPELPLLSITREKGVIERDVEDQDSNHNFIPDDLSGYKMLKAGQFGMNKMKAWQGSYGVSQYTGIVSPAYYVFDFVKPIQPIFFNWAIRSDIYISFFGGASDGARIGQWDLSKSRMKEIPFVIPPHQEQTAIANFLDQKTAQIDEAIAIKEQQIELLKERKQIIIQKAVTQGLSPSIFMKNSGVDWIGKVPEHWEVLRFKNIFKQSRLPVRGTDEVVTSYRDGQVTLRSNRRLDGYTEAILEGGYQGIRTGQLVLNSMDAFEGAIGVSESDGKCTPEYVICDPKSTNVSPNYFAYLLREMALAKYIQVICNAVRQRAIRIRFNNLASQFVVLPPKYEQELIVKFIEIESKKINQGIAHLKDQIEKLKEYKTTLINSAVTGKIKVTDEN